MTRGGVAGIRNYALQRIIANPGRSSDRCAKWALDAACQALPSRVLT